MTYRGKSLDAPAYEVTELPDPPMRSGGGTWLRHGHSCDRPVFMGARGDRWRCDECGRVWKWQVIWQAWGTTWRSRLSHLFRK